MNRWLPLVCLCACAGLAAAAPAQVADVAAEAAQTPIPRDFGTGNANVLQIPAPAFLPSLTGNWTYDSSFYFYPGNGSAVYAWAPLQLPSGAKIEQIGLYYDDTDAANDILVTLYSFTGYNASATHATVGTVSSSGSGGKNYAASSAVSYTVNNNVRNGTGAQLMIQIYVPNSNTKFKAVDVTWVRQISPAPAVATFNDVPTNHPFFAVIEAFAKSGITTGCGNGNFCPSQTVTRQELAKFFARGLGLSWPDSAEP